MSLAAAAASADGFLGFRLLDLDGGLVKWHGSGAKPVRLTYSFVSAPAAEPGARNCRAMMPLDQLLVRSRVHEDVLRSEVREAFAMWSRVTRIDFEYAQDARSADIVIGAQAEPFGRAFTDVKFEDRADGAQTIERSRICLNPSMSWKVGFDGDLSVYDLRYTIAHEIGHAIGLNHPSASGQLMSYRYDERARSLQPGDIAGAVTLYGARGVDTVVPLRAVPITAGIARPKKMEGTTTAAPSGTPHSGPTNRAY